MLDGVNFSTTNYAFKSKAQNQQGSAPNQSRTNIHFGYGEESSGIWDNLKHGVFALTDDAMSLVGVNAALWFMQNYVNGKLLVGKINKHYTKDIQDNVQLKALADEMLEKEGLQNKVEILPGKEGEAFFTHEGNKIVVGKDNYSSLFHEAGHAIIENKTTLLKKLQRFRGNYTILSLLLYGLLSQNKDGDSKRKDYVIPLLAFAPELITEGAASLKGLKFLKGKIGKEASLYKNIKKSYITCFGTYLFIPVSIMLIDFVRNSVHREREKRQMKRMGYM